MTRRKTTVVAVAGAVALASGAYALGSQTGDGSAEAARTARGEVAFGHGFGPGRPGDPGLRPGFDALADRLGVDEDELRKAIEDIASARKDDLAQRLAEALGVERAKVEQALENARPDRPHMRRPERFAAALAKELGLSTEKVQNALEKRRGRPGGPADLAADLGVSERKLKEAFHAMFGRLRPPRPPFGDLAKELGVTQAQLDAAFEKLRGQKDELRDEFAKQLADRLGLDEAKVQDALDALHPPRFP